MSAQTGSGYFTTNDRCKSTGKKYKWNLWYNYQTINAISMKTVLTISALTPV